MTIPMPSRFVRFLFANLFLLGGIGTLAQAEQAELILPTQSTDPVVLSHDTFRAGQRPADLFQVFVGEASECCEGRNPISGNYKKVPEGLAFTPLFGFDAGQSYVVRNMAGTSPTMTPFALSLEGDEAQASVVTSIFPSGAHLPENTLRFYIHFSEPMKPHVSTDYIRLINADGQVDDAAFMSFKQELWSPDRTRLTLLMDPGRIKRGVAQNETLGPALEEGGGYKLVVEAGWPTASGKASLMRFEKEFGVSAPLRNRPDVAYWKINAPKAGSTAALKIVFDRPFDAARLTSDIQIFDGSGQRIEGTVAVGSSETCWTFVPDQNWPFDDIRLTVRTTLEDVAGNNFNELLDHAVGAEGAAFKVMVRHVTLAQFEESE